MIDIRRLEISLRVEKLQYLINALMEVDEACGDKMHPNISRRLKRMETEINEQNELFKLLSL